MVKNVFLSLGRIGNERSSCNHMLEEVMKEVPATTC
jgi:hypothetical protein